VHKQTENALELFCVVTQLVYVFVGGCLVNRFS